ncbi:MAG: retroviral-like aspartic protease family protein [Pirellulales bacterium]
MNIRFEPRHGLIVVQAELWGPAGSTILRMALDTGAMTTLVNAAPLAWVGYDPALSTERVQITTGSGVEFTPQLPVERIRALGHERVDHIVLCHTLPPSANVDGLLGLDFLRGHKLVIDFDTGQLTLD